MVVLTIGALQGRREATVENWAQVAPLRAGGNGAPVLRPAVMERAKGANGMGDSAPLLDMAEVPAVPALGDRGGGIRFFDLAGTAEEV